MIFKRHLKNTAPNITLKCSDTEMGTFHCFEGKQLAARDLPRLSGSVGNVYTRLPLAARVIRIETDDAYRNCGKDERPYFVGAMREPTTYAGFAVIALRF